MTDQAPEVPKDDDVAIAGIMFRVGSAFDEYTSQMRRALTLNAHERLAIALLWSRGAMTMTELGAGIPLSRAAVTTLVDRLEKAGLVRRTGDADDRRRTVVELADAAISRMRPVIAPWKADLAEVVARRTDEEWRAIVDFLSEFKHLNIRHAARLAEIDDTDIQALAHVRA